MPKPKTTKRLTTALRSAARPRGYDWNPDIGLSRFYRTLAGIETSPGEVIIYLIPIGVILIARDDKVARLFVSRYTAEMKYAIQRQSYKHASLSAAYLDWKKSKGLNTGIYIASGTFAKNIDYRAASRGKVRYYRVGFKNKLHQPSYRPKSKLDNNLLAYWLEFGTKKMPERPLWRRSLAVMLRKPAFKGKVDSFTDARIRTRRVKKGYRNLAIPASGVKTLVRKGVKV